MSSNLKNIIKKNESKLFGRNSFKTILGEGGMSVVYDMGDFAAKITSLNKNSSRIHVNEGEVFLEYIGGKTYYCFSKTSGAIEFDAKEMFMVYHQYVVSENYITTFLKNIPSIINFGDLRYLFIDDLFLAIQEMDKIEGKNMLQEMTKAGGISLSDAVTAGLTLCETVNKFGKERFIHRDIKSANVMYDKKENLYKLIDFGLATNIDKFDFLKYEDSSDAKILTNKGISDANCMVGTVGYSSPEAIGFLDLNNKDDIFSTGVTVYEFLTGCMLFRDYKLLMSYGEDEMRTVSERLEAERFPKKLKTAILRTVDYKRNDRSLELLQDQLQKIASNDSNYKAPWLPICGDNRIRLI